MPFDTYYYLLFLDIYPEVELLGYMVYICFPSVGTVKYFSNGVVEIYTFLLLPASYPHPYLVFFFIFFKFYPLCLCNGISSGFLICIRLITNDIEHTFICLSATLIPSFVKSLSICLLAVVIRLTAFFLLVCINSLYVLDIKYLSNVCITNLSSSPVLLSELF